MGIDRITRGWRIRSDRFGDLRICWTTKNWRSKTHPYWFYRHYREGVWTFQSMRLEVWYRHEFRAARSRKKQYDAA